jgi:hypothetical protein
MVTSLFSTAIYSLILISLVSFNMQMSSYVIIMHLQLISTMLFFDYSSIFPRVHVSSVLKVLYPLAKMDGSVGDGVGVLVRCSRWKRNGLGRGV